MKECAEEPARKTNPKHIFTGSLLVLYQLPQIRRKIENFPPLTQVTDT